MVELKVQMLECSKDCLEGRWYKGANDQYDKGLVEGKNVSISNSWKDSWINRKNIVKANIWRSYWRYVRWLKRWN